MNEEWRPIAGYEGYYEASNLGRVRSLDRYIDYTCQGEHKKMFKHSKMITPRCCGGNIPYIQLMKDANPIMYRLDTLIATIWISNPNNHSCVIHRDDNYMNNCINNLEWASYYHTAGTFDSEWRAIPGYEDIYQVSSNGRVRSIPRVIKRIRNIRGKKVGKDTAEYESRELKPCRYLKKSNMPVYHLHRRYKSGYYGQSDEYFTSEALIMLAFPELYE